MDEQRSTWNRVLLSFAAVACVGGAALVLPTRMEAVVIALLALALLFGWLAVDPRVVDKFTLPGGVGAEFRKATLNEARRIVELRGSSHGRTEVSGNLTVKPPTLQARSTVYPPTVTVTDKPLEGQLVPEGRLETTHIGAADSGGVGAASVERTPEQYEQLAVWAKTPEQFATLILDAVEAERERIRRKQSQASGDDAPTAHEH